MYIIEAAQSTYDIASRGQKEIYPEKHKEGLGPCHALWMLDGIIKGYIQHDKAHRWLGYAQGVLVTCNYMTLRKCKELNNNE